MTYLPSLTPKGSDLPTPSSLGMKTYLHPCGYCNKWSKLPVLQIDKNQHEYKQHVL